MIGLPRYALEIDEEGYPLFEGIRVQDEGLLKSLLNSIKRLRPNDLRSALVCECEGETLFLNAFSAPLIATRVERIANGNFLWTFPAGSRPTEVKLSEILKDSWNRLGAYLGEDKIFAMLSRATQGQFLNLLTPEELKTFKPQDFHHPDSKEVSHCNFWDQAYREGRDGWEMKGPTPVLTNCYLRIKNELKRNSRILVPGAGRGHDAIFLAELGHQVVALDFSQEAVDEFKKHYPESSVDYRQADFFSFATDPKNYDSFDAVFEHTIFCAIEPARRDEYLSAVRDLLKPGGLYFGSFLMRSMPGGPAFSLNQWELRERTKDIFKIRDWYFAFKESHTARQGIEYWICLQK